MWSNRGKTVDAVLQRLVKTVNNANGVPIVSGDSSTYFHTDLAFYTDFKRYSLFDLSFTPYLQFDLLDNGQHTLLLDGSFKPFEQANKLSPPSLTGQNVFEYARLVVNTMEMNGCRMRVVGSIEEVDFDSEPTPEQYRQLESTIKAPAIRTIDNVFAIVATLLLADTINYININVYGDGRVDILGVEKILESMPVRELIID
jgi:hypothetical protein